MKLTVFVGFRERKGGRVTCAHQKMASFLGSIPKEARFMIRDIWHSFSQEATHGYEAASVFREGFVLREIAVCSGKELNEERLGCQMQRSGRSLIWTGIRS